MTSAELSIPRRDGQVVVVLSGKLDVVDAAHVAAALAVIAASGNQIIVDLAGLESIVDLAGPESIDSSGLAALVRARQSAQKAGFDVLLAAPQQQVRRMLAITGPLDAFSIHACVDEAIGKPGHLAWP